MSRSIARLVSCSTRAGFPSSYLRPKMPLNSARESVLSPSLFHRVKNCAYVSLDAVSPPRGLTPSTASPNAT